MSLCWWFSEEVARKKRVWKMTELYPVLIWKVDFTRNIQLGFRCFRQNIIIVFVVSWVSTFANAQWALELYKTFDGFPTNFQQLKAKVLEAKTSASLSFYGSKLDAGGVSAELEIHLN